MILLYWEVLFQDFLFFHVINLLIYIIYFFILFKLLIY